MARVEQTDLVVNSRGVPQANVPVSIKPVAGSSGTSKLWQAETGEGEVSSVVTNNLGVYSVWLDEGRYDIDPTGAKAKRVEVINQTSITIAGPGFNTRQIFQSINGQNPTEIPDTLAPTVSQFASAGLYNDKTAGEIFQIAAYIKNTAGAEARGGSAIFGYGQGNNQEGGTFTASTLATGDAATGVEIDVGNFGGKEQASGAVDALIIAGKSKRESPNNTGTVLKIQASSATESNGSFANGIWFKYTGAGTSNTAPVLNELMLSDGFTTVNGLDLRATVFTSSALHLPLNSGSVAASNAILIWANGGFANAGAGIQIQAKSAGSTMAYGLRFHVTGGNAPVATTGTLFYADGGTYTYGISLSAATFSTAAIDLGDNHIKVGSVTGCRIATANTQLLGFWGKTPIAQPAKPAKTVEAVIELLESIGLCA